MIKTIYLDMLHRQYAKEWNKKNKFLLQHM